VEQRDELVVRQAMGDWILSQVRPSVFGGLTHDPRRRVVKLAAQRADKRGFTRLAARLTDGDTPRRLADVPIGRDPAVARVFEWLTACEQATGKGIAGLVALEYHRNGAPHFHPLLELAGGLDQGDIVKMGLPWYRANGGNRLQVPRSEGEAAAYCAKYVCKQPEHGDLLFWPRGGELRTVPVLESGEVGRIRQAVGCSVKRFAQLLQVPAAAVYWWEQGHRQPDPVERQRIRALAPGSTPELRMEELA
jgi:hypothetical protein